MMANNETGVLQPVDAIGKVAAEPNVYFHTDGVQAAGKVPIDVQSSAVTCFRFPAIRCMPLKASVHSTSVKERFFSPCFMAAAMSAPAAPAPRMSRDYRSGKSRRDPEDALDRGDLAQMAAIRDRFSGEDSRRSRGHWRNGAGAPRMANTTNIHFDYIEGEALVIALDLKGLAVSTGAACSSGAIEPSHVLTAMGLAAEQARASLRFSLGKQNTPEDVDLLLSILPANRFAAAGA